jgi:hypothetical protein
MTTTSPLRTHHRSPRPMRRIATSKSPRSMQPQRRSRSRNSHRPTADCPCFSFISSPNRGTSSPNQKTLAHNLFCARVFCYWCRTHDNLSRAFRMLLGRPEEATLSQALQLIPVIAIDNDSGVEFDQHSDPNQRRDESIAHRRPDFVGNFLLFCVQFDGLDGSNL